MEGDDGAVMVVDLALWNEGCDAIETLIGGEEDEEVGAGNTARPPTPTGWSDTDWIKHLQEQQHPLAGLHINQGSMDAAADAYEAEYNARHNAEVTGTP